MKLLNRLLETWKLKKYPERCFNITVTATSVKVEHPKRATEQIDWGDIKKISLVTTDEGPWQPDVWLFLIGEDSSCMVPTSAPKYDEVYQVVAKLEGFDFLAYLAAMGTTRYASFDLWEKERK